MLLNWTRWGRGKNPAKNAGLFRTTKSWFHAKKTRKQSYRKYVILYIYLHDLACNYSMLICYCQRCPWSHGVRMPDHTSWLQSWQRCSKLFDLVWAVKSFSSTSRFSCNLSCACCSLGKGWGQVHGQLCLSQDKSRVHSRVFVKVCLQ